MVRKQEWQNKRAIFLTFTNLTFYVILKQREDMDVAHTRYFPRFSLGTPPGNPMVGHRGQCDLPFAENYKLPNCCVRCAYVIEFKSGQSRAHPQNPMLPMLARLPVLARLVMLLMQPNGRQERVRAHFSQFISFCCPRSLQGNIITKNIVRNRRNEKMAA